MTREQFAAAHGFAPLIWTREITGHEPRVLARWSVFETMGATEADALAALNRRIKGYRDDQHAAEKRASGDVPAVGAECYDHEDT
jgi:hypothetical protein